MERKNTVMLTVIAIATLLVAVVGATFAFFTASVNNETDDADRKVEVTTRAMTTATFTGGATIPSITETKVYPGFESAKPITIAKTCANDKGCQDVGAKLVVTADIPADFGTDVTWAIYKVGTAGAIECTTTPIETPNDAGQIQCHDAGSCKGIPTDASAKILDSSSGKNEVVISKTTDATVPKSGVTEYYYLVVSYKNDTTVANQNGQQGKTFSVSVDYKPTTPVPVAPSTTENE